MKKLLWFVCCLMLSACSVKVGEFTPERHALYSEGQPDCDKTPERCINGYPW